MTLVADTSVWSDLIRKKPGAHVEQLRSLLSAGHEVVVGDIIAVELLRGFKPGRMLRAAEIIVEEYGRAEMVGFDRATRAAGLYRAPRRNGRTVRNSNDAPIASYCIDESLPLLCVDRDFDGYVEHFGLRRV